MRTRSYVITMVALVLPATPHAWGHEAHMLVGRTAEGQLTWHRADGVPNEALTVLEEIPPGGPLEGFSASIPGFSDVVIASPEHDVYPLEAGADVWMEQLDVDPALLQIQTPSFLIINFLAPPEMRIGGPGSHAHPIWLIDTTDPAFEPDQCVWVVTFILKDKGATDYADSEPLMFAFSAGFAPCPADYDCDNDVDSDDFELFAACATGPALPYDPENLPPACAAEPDDEEIIAPDLDRDGDVDQRDFSLFQRCITAPDQPADPQCAALGSS